MARAKTVQEREAREARSFILREQGKSYEQIAQIVGVSRWQVKTDVQRARDTRLTELGMVSALTAHVSTILINTMSAGVPFSEACGLAGVSDSLCREWVKQGQTAIEAFNNTGELPRKADGPYIKLATDLKRASATDVGTRVSRINGHAQEHWQADKWLLETVHAPTFAPRSQPQVEVNVSVEGMAQADIIKQARKIVALDAQRDQRRAIAIESETEDAVEVTEPEPVAPKPSRQRPSHLPGAAVPPQAGTPEPQKFRSNVTGDEESSDLVAIAPWDDPDSDRYESQHDRPTR